MSSKKELDFSNVRQLCAGIAAREKISVNVVKSRKYSVISLPTQRKKSIAGDEISDNLKSLEYILLNELNVKGRDRLMQRMSTLMRSLKTTDIATAQTFIHLERYADVRSNIVQQLHEFVAKDLKMTVANVNPED